MSESPEWCNWAAQRIKELDAEVERQTTECIKRGFEVESLMTELSSLKLMVEKQNELVEVLKKIIELVEFNQKGNHILDVAGEAMLGRLCAKARQALGEKE